MVAVALVIYCPCARSSCYYYCIVVAAIPAVAVVANVVGSWLPLYLFLFLFYKNSVAVAVFH